MIKRILALETAAETGGGRRLPPTLWLLSALLLAGAAAPRIWGQAETPSYQATNYDLQVELAPELHQLRARARVNIVARRPLASLTFHLNRNLRVENVFDAQDKAMAFEQPPQTGTFRVDLAQPLAAEQTLTLKVAYAGAFDPALKPEIGPPYAVIGTEGSYLLPEARWFPQGSNLWDRYTMSLTATVPADLTAIAPGQSSPPAGTGQGSVRFSFRSEQPTRPGTLVVGRYEKITESRGAPVNFHLRTVPSAFAASNVERMADIVAFFSEKFGALSEPAVSLVEVPDDGLESYAAPGLLLLPTRQWSNEINYRLLARSVAEQWWAGRVLPASEADVWLAVGLARYSEALYVEKEGGEGALEQVLEDLTIGALVDESAAPIANANQLVPLSPEYNSVVRDKGAMVFHMLRRVVGDETFFKLLREYAQRFAGRSATIDGFERLAEEVSGQPLDYFFGEWVRSTGVPEFDMEYVTYRTREGFRVEGTIKHELEIFRMPVEIRVETEGPPVTQTVEVAGTSSPFAIPCFGKPVSIKIDPGFNVLKYTPDLRLRVAIARGESLFERNDYFAAIREYQNALQVKRNSSLAHYRLGEAFFEQRNYQSAANSFREAVNGDQIPKWTVVWSRIFLGKVFDLTGQRERAINEYRRAIETNDDTMGAQAEAQKYLREPYRRETREIKRLDQNQP